MKRVRTALVLTGLVAFGFGAMNGCGTEPITSHKRAMPVGGSGDAAGDVDMGAGGSSVGGDQGVGGSGNTSAGSANGGAPGMAGDATGVGGTGGGASGSAMAGSDNGGASGAGGSSGAGGTNGGASGAGGAGGTAGASGASGAAGAGGSTPVGCTNATVVDAAGSTTKCPAIGTWTVTAMPTPASMYMGIPDTKLQPKYAIDGNTGTRFSTATVSAAGQWFRVDLGAATQITGIVLDNTIDINDIAYGYKVEVSTDGTAWTQVATCNAIASTTETINFAAKPGRYVRITVTAPGIHWWSIDELSVLCK